MVVSTTTTAAFDADELTIALGLSRDLACTFERVLVLVLAIETRYSRTTNVKKLSTPSDSSGTGRRRRRRAVQYLLLFIGGVLVVDALVGDKGLIEMLKKREQYRALEQTLTRSRAENARLREEARRLKEEPAAVEEIARRELGLIKPGEKLFIIRDIPPADAAPKD
jgi:cell division protein FtsB